MNRSDQGLIVAAGENNLQEARRLLSVGADVNYKDNDGETPLSVASYNGHVQVVTELVEHGADIEAKDNVGDTSLHCAWWNGHLAVVNELLSPNDSIGTTTIKTILGKRKSRGADTEAKNDQGSTPLHIACYNGRVAVVKALVIGGADILAANNDGRLPIHQAMGYRRSAAAVSKYLFPHFYAKICGCLPLHKLLEDLTWIGDPYSREAPPIREALYRAVLGTDDVVVILDYLVDRDPAWLCSRDQEGSLPLHVACRRGAAFSIVQSLVNHDKSSVKSMTSGGDLPLFLACEMPDTSLSTIFILMKLYPDMVHR
jgi:ankyrin repeat protein